MCCQTARPKRTSETIRVWMMLDCCVLFSCDYFLNEHAYVICATRKREQHWWLRCDWFVKKYQPKLTIQVFRNEIRHLTKYIIAWQRTLFHVYSCVSDSFSCRQKYEWNYLVQAINLIRFTNENERFFSAKIIESE